MSVECKEVFKEGLIKSLHFKENYPMHAKAIKVLINSLHFLSQVHPLVFHGKETISDHYSKLKDEKSTYSQGHMPALAAMFPQFKFLCLEVLHRLVLVQPFQ